MNSIQEKLVMETNKIMDDRKDFILKTAGNYFSDENLDAFKTDKFIEEFLDNIDCLTLIVKNQDESSKLDFTNEITQSLSSSASGDGNKQSRMLIFYKVCPAVITSTNLHEVISFTSVVGSPLNGFYHSLSRIFAPALLSTDNESVGPKMSLLLGDLESSLRSAVFKSNNDDRTNVSHVTNVLDEYKFWSSVLDLGKRKSDKEKAKVFVEILKPLCKAIEDQEGCDLDDMSELAYNTVDDLWKADEYRFPQTRMENLMEIIGRTFSGIVIARIKSVDLWKGAFLDVEEILLQGIACCGRWPEMCERLTSLFWPHHSLHPWAGEPFRPGHISKFAERLKDVRKIRTVHRQICRLLSPTEVADFGLDTCFKYFTEINALNLSPYNELNWSQSVKQFENAIKPAEEHVARKILQHFQSVNVNTMQLLQEFRKYQELIERPHVRSLLTPQRECLLGLLQDHVAKLNADGFDDKCNWSINYDMSPLVKKIYWLHQQEFQMAQVEKTISFVLSDLNDFDKLEESVKSGRKQLKDSISELLDSWTREVGTAIAGKRLGLRTSEPVVQFEQGKLMKVNYNPQLVALVKDVRQISVLGYMIPSSIIETAGLARSFIKQARELQQVATFHNTIGDRMIVSQRPMMLTAAVELARLVREQHSVTWKNTAAVDSYIKKLQSAVDRLYRENTQLNGFHNKINNIVMNLMDTDLLRQQQRWKEGLREIREIMSRVEEDFTNTKSWRCHWDHQIYKALEYRYRVGLERLHEHLPEIRADLVYRQQQLMFSPPIEDIRMKYYRQLKHFLAIPQALRGVSDANIFPLIINNNAHRFEGVFAKAKDLFTRVLDVCDEWQDWVALGSVDWDLLIEQNLLTADDWALNFKASKALGQQIAKLSGSERKVGCILISVAPVRAEVEMHNRRYWDILSSSLHLSVIQDVKKLENFILESKSSLEKAPQSLQEVGEINSKFEGISNAAKNMFTLIESADKKNKILASWTKEHVDDVSRMSILWENFQGLLSNQQYIISKQVDMMKSNLVGEAERLQSDVERFALRWEQMKPREDNLHEEGHGQKVMELLKEKRSQWDTLTQSVATMIEDFTRFGIKDQLPDFPDMDRVEEDLKHHEGTWALYSEFTLELSEMGREEWIVFRGKCLAQLEKFITRWSSKLIDRPASSVSVYLMQELDSIKDMMPVLKFVRGEMFSDKHWMEVFNLLGLQYMPTEQITFNEILKSKSNIIKNSTLLQELNTKAASEIIIRQALSDLDIWEVEAKFTMIAHTDCHGEVVNLIKDFNDVMTRVGDNQCLLQSIKSSPNFDDFIDRARIWENRLSDLDNNLRMLNQVQRKWIYLEPIFGAGTLKVESTRFERVDKDLRIILNDLYNGDHRVINLCKMHNLNNTLNSACQHLTVCQKNLLQFLEEKRNKFPRFYFIGDEDLLEILGQSQKRHVIQAHLKKLFAGIHSVKFDTDNRITAMCSLQGEIVALDSPVHLTANVEEWLSELALEMTRTLRKLVQNCLESPDPLLYPSQVLCLAERVSFTKRCEESIKNKHLDSLLKSLQAQLEAYTKQQNEWRINRGSTKTDDSDNLGVLELKLKSLLIDTIYHKDIVIELLKANVTDVNDWDWQRRLRFYLSRTGEVIVRMVDVEFTYSHEYQGNAARLVHTPLTDKCYLTLTQAMSAGLGGNPYGPAGTGKTESVKALGMLLGRQVLVFNCDEGIDAQSMTRILIGLVKCGSWGCFDEFNRLDETTLSAISIQIHTIQEALRKKSKTISLLDQEVSVDHKTGIFVTMNPAGRGYGGRQQLPDNLKQLFRPVVMSKPDETIIAQTILHCEGFKQAEEIGCKLVTLFAMAKKLLSEQQHYDWGLRALKTVVAGCGNALREHFTEQNTIVENENLEMKLAVRVVRLNTLSKLTFTDSRRFDMLIKDTFPSVEFEMFAHAKLAEAVESAYGEFNLTPNKWQVRKCTELYEQLIQRMGVVVVGPPGSGKSTVIKLLKQALKKMNVTVKQSVINPKAMNRAQLLGQTDPDTRQWIDGVLSSTSQMAYNVPSDVQYWIVFDGDVDPEWIESLNSVLDDNRLLTLPSGWRIQFGPNVHFLFETDSVKHASPATISRMGVILLSEEDLDTKSLVESWLKLQPEGDQLTLSCFINDYLYRSVEWVLNESHNRIGEIKSISVVKNGLSRLAGATTRAKFAYCLATGLGALLSPSYRELFYKFVFDLTGELIATMDLSDSLIQNCFYDSRRDCIDIYSTLTSNTDDKNNTIRPFSLVLTGQVQACIDTVLDWLQMKQPLILYGPPGSGKSILLNYCFNKLHNFKVATIHCSANITPHHLLQKLAQFCIIVSSSTGRVYRPKSSEYLILHFKDINRIQPDRWGTCMLIQFLQQFLSYKGFYDSTLEWVAFENIQIVCSVSSLESISKRFLSMNRIYCLPSPEKNELQAIFTCYIKSLLGSNSKSSSIATVMINIYEAIKNTFNNNLSNPHYIFTPRDVTRWCIGLLRYPLSDKVNQCTIEALLYEAERRFKQRMVSYEDRERYDNIISTVLDSDWSALQTKGDKNNAVFICDSPNRNNEAIFIRLELTDWSKMVEQEVTRLGVTDVVILPELSKLVANIEQSLINTGESLLLVGQAGVGRKTALKIAASRLNATLVSPKIGPKYTTSNFKNDLKKVMQTAGIDGEQVFLLLEDHQLIQSEFMDMVNSLLSSSEIPGLYHVDELESLTAAISDLAEQVNFDGTTIEYFTKRVSENLHIVLLLDSTSPKFSQHLTSNPAMLKNCHIIWLNEWSTDSFRLIPSLMINKESELISDQLIEIFVDVHKEACSSSILKRNVCPKQYFSLVTTYNKLVTDFNNSIQQRKGRLQAGISKLSDAKNVVAQLKLEAAEQEKLLGVKQEKATSALEMITETMSNTNTQRGQMEVLKAQTEQENDALVARKAEIEAELQEIEPLIKEACAAVGNIKSEALSEIRSLRAPPDVIRDILEGVLRLMGIQDTSWNSMKTFLAKRGVKEDIRCFDAHKITPESRESVEHMLLERKDSFNPKTAKRASVAAAPLASWVTANVKYSKVLEKIRPLEREQAKLERNLKSSEDRIVKLSSGLEDVDQTVAELKIKLNTFTKEAAEIEIHLNKAHETISAAEVLVSKLDDEYSRWQVQLNELSENLERLPANSLLAAASIVYLSASSQDVRSKMMGTWCEKLGLKEFSLVSFLGKESEMIQWQSEGLPSDQLSIENALVVMKSELCPLLVDPTCQGQGWLEKRVEKLREGKPGAVEVVSYSSPRLFTVLEFAIRFGKYLVINEVMKIDPFLYPILRGDFTFQGPRKMVQLGDKNVDYNPDFRLFLTTRTVDCSITPDALAYITKVNFMTSPAGLAQQLLACALNTEQPELEERRKELLHQEEALRLQLDGMQENVLNRLASADGDILQNRDLLNSLNETKRSSHMIEESLQEFVKLQDELKNHYSSYQPLAEYASNLYFAIAALPSLNSIYCISVNAFLRLFQTSLKSSQDIDKNNKCTHLLHLVYYQVSRSLFRSDHLTFGLHLAHAMNPHLFKPNEWELFTRQSNISEIKSEFSSSSSENVPKWIDQDRIYDVQLFLSTFPELYDSLKLDDEKCWKGYPRSLVKPPVSITLFQEVLLVQALSPDYLCTILVDFTCKALGLESLSAPPLSLNELYKETVAEEPIMIISGQGSDPSTELRSLVAGVSPVNCYEVALGEGQEKEVLRLLRLAAVDGSWLILKNVHLMTGWLTQLEAEYRMLVDLNKDFRLWLTTQQHSAFPSLLISQCLKVTYEAPPGVKRNMQRTYGSWEQDPLMQTTIPGPLFNLAWFHALVLERRTIIPQGWVKFYEFNETDLSAALIIMKSVLEKAGRGGMNWQFFKGLCEGAVYGGRVDNTYDLRVLSAYLEKFFTVDRLTALDIGVDLPQTNNIREHIKTIEKMSDVDSPTWFGFPANVDRSWQRNTSAHVINQLQLITVSDISEKNSSNTMNDWHHYQLNPVLNLWKKLNQGVALLKMKEPSSNVDDNQESPEDPLQFFVQSEFHFALRLVHHIHSGLAAITRVLKSSSQPSTRVDSLAQALVRHQVPEEWESIWRCSAVNDSMRYLRSVMTRAIAVHSLVSHKSGITLSSLDLADIFHPETLLNALRQQTARRLGISIDDLNLRCSWSPITNAKDSSNAEQKQLTIVGLQLEGAQFDSHQLSANTADSPDVTVAPPLLLSWARTTLVSEDEDNVLRVPLYSSVDRDHVISELTVPCLPAERQKWILASVAFYIRN